MSSRRLQEMSSRRLQDMSSKRLQEISSRRLQDMSSRRLPRHLQRNNFSSSKSSSRRLQDVFRDVFKTFSRRLHDVLKTSWKTKNCCTEDVLYTSSRHVFKTSSRGFEHQQMFAGNLVISFRQILSQERTVVEPEPVVQLSVPPIPSSLVAYELRPPALALWRRRGECYTYLGQLFSWSTTLLSSEKI